MPQHDLNRFECLEIKERLAMMTTNPAQYKLNDAKLCHDAGTAEPAFRTADHPNWGGLCLRPT